MRGASSRFRSVSVTSQSMKRSIAPAATLLLALAASCISSAALAIIMRHDRQTQQFVGLASRFPATASLYSTGRAKRFRGSGTLIAPDWILTAAHVATALVPGDRAELGERSSTIDRVVLHPDWKDLRDTGSDIALLHLQSSVESIVPAAAYTGTDEAGMFVTFVGRGTLGTGLTGDTGKQARRLRAATNRVDKAESPFLQFRFDAPGDPNVTELEGISGAGDSGGPAFVERDGRLYVIGVSSWQDFKPAHYQEGRYGVLEYYMRVSDFAAWIRSTIQAGTMQGSTLQPQPARS
jgi:hypothetical protein